jgi:hypothetical protein
MILIIRGHIRNSFDNDALYNLVKSIYLIDKSVNIYLHTWEKKQTSLSWREIKNDDTKMTNEYILGYFKDLASKINRIFIINEDNINHTGVKEGLICRTRCPILGWKNYWFGQYDIVSYLQKRLKNSNEMIINMRFDILCNPFSYPENEIINFIKNHKNLSKINENKFISDNYLLGIDNIYIGNIYTMNKLISHFHKNIDRIIKIDESLINQEKLVYYENLKMFDRRNNMIRRVDKYNPVSTIHNIEIYDIFYNDLHEIVILMPFENYPRNIVLLDGDINIKFDVSFFPIMLLVYKLKTNSYKPKILLAIDGLTMQTNVNIYPIYENKIIMSTLVDNKNTYIKQWIRHYINLGISNFIIYDNNLLDDSVSEILKDYILEKSVIVIKWPWKENETTICKDLYKNHSIYAFRQSRYIGFFNIEECVNVNNKDINSFFSDVLLSNDCGYEHLSCFKFLNKTFNNTDSMNVDSGSNFIKETEDTSVIKNVKDRYFILPKNVDSISNNITNSYKKIFDIDESIGYFNEIVI